MNNYLRHITLLMLAILSLGSAEAQRRVTPVEQTSQRKRAEIEQQFDRSRLKETTDSRGQIVLVDTVTGLEYHDTLTNRIPRMIYPRLYQVAAGVNFWDMAMRCLGQQYGLGSIWAELSMHNRYFPRFEFGLGAASITPDNSNFTFKSPLSPFFKIGAAYNIFYNSNPAYRFLVGLNYGFSTFKYSIDNVTVADGYWDENSIFDIPSQSATAGFFEVTAGVRVKIVGDFSIGWNLIYHQMLHESKAPLGKPMYIPGYGKRGTTFTATLSLLWNFTLNKKAVTTVDNGE